MKHDLCNYKKLFCAWRIDASKSTKGASKLRRDLINAEIANLRDLLPLPPSTRQRLSQLQLMALVCVFLRKANYFQQGKYPQNTFFIPLQFSIRCLLFPLLLLSLITYLILQTELRLQTRKMSKIAVKQCFKPLLDWDLSSLMFGRFS